jgi:hypothetical protein
MIEEPDDEDALDITELVPAKGGGEWHGLLFDNPTIGLAPQLTWGFSFPFNDVIRAYGSSPASLDIDWMPLPTQSWRSMAGQHARSARFGEPGEASVYHFQHHRYDAIDLHVVRQRDLRIHAYAKVSGDLDDLGIETIATDAWLRFTGIFVSLSDTSSADAALARLRDFTDTTGLSFSPVPSNASFRFAPSPA